MQQNYLEDMLRHKITGSHTQFSDSGSGSWVGLRTWQHLKNHCSATATLLRVWLVMLFFTWILEFVGDQGNCQYKDSQRTERYTAWAQRLVWCYQVFYYNSVSQHAKIFVRFTALDSDVHHVLLILCLKFLWFTVSTIRQILSPT